MRLDAVHDVEHLVDLLGVLLYACDLAQVAELDLLFERKKAVCTQEGRNTEQTTRTRKRCMPFKPSLSRPLFQEACAESHTSL